MGFFDINKQNRQALEIERLNREINQLSKKTRPISNLLRKRITTRATILLLSWLMNFGIFPHF